MFILIQVWVLIGISLVLLQIFHLFVNKGQCQYIQSNLQDDNEIRIQFVVEDKTLTWAKN